MIRTYADVLTIDELASLREVARTCEFVDGRESASPRLAETKQNEQMAGRDPAMADVARIVGAALQRNGAFCATTLPRQMHSLRLARYRVGMRYGAHVDSALMVDGTVRARADLSFTLFLNDPSEYDGGELRLETGGEGTSFKLPARQLVVYETGQLHEVTPVLRGERLVVVGWIESVVRHEDSRETLADLAAAMDLVHASEGKSRAYDLLVKSHANLLRRWAEG